MTEQKDIHLKLRAEPGVLIDIALRRALKDMLRRRGLRCVDFREVEPVEPLKPEGKNDEP